MHNGGTGKGSLAQEGASKVGPPLARCRSVGHFTLSRGLSESQQGLCREKAGERRKEEGRKREKEGVSGEGHVSGPMSMLQPPCLQASAAHPWTAELTLSSQPAQAHLTPPGLPRHRPDNVFPEHFNPRYHHCHNLLAISGMSPVGSKQDRVICYPFLHQLSVDPGHLSASVKALSSANCAVTLVCPHF